MSKKYDLKTIMNYLYVHKEDLEKDGKIISETEKIQIELFLQTEAGIKLKRKLFLVGDLLKKEFTEPEIEVNISEEEANELINKAKVSAFSNNNVISIETYKGKFMSAKKGTEGPKNFSGKGDIIDFGSINLKVAGGTKSISSNNFKSVEQEEIVDLGNISVRVVITETIEKPRLELGFKFFAQIDHKKTELELKGFSVKIETGTDTFEEVDFEINDFIDHENLDLQIELVIEKDAGFDEDCDLGNYQKESLENYIKELNNLESDRYSLIDMHFSNK